jgi:predicted ATPase
MTTAPAPRFGALLSHAAVRADVAFSLEGLAQVVVGLRETGSRPLGEMLQRTLHARRLLLVLDNHEHVLAGAGAVAAQLEGCPQLVVLATSRAPLRVRGEHQYPVAPLALPAFDHAPTADEAASGGGAAFLEWRGSI